MTYPYPYFVYILTNKSNQVYYVGVTNDLRTRVWEHRTKLSPYLFTSRYNIYKLVYFENFEFIAEAIKREKYIKEKPRGWKQDLIRSLNPEWRELEM